MKMKSQTYSNSWDTINAVLIGKFIKLLAFIMKLENSHTKELKVNLKAIEKTSKHTQSGSRQQAIMKLRAEVNQLERE